MARGWQDTHAYDDCKPLFATFACCTTHLCLLLCLLSIHFFGDLHARKSEKQAQQESQG